MAKKEREPETLEAGRTKGGKEKKTKQTEEETCVSGTYVNPWIFKQDERSENRQRVHELRAKFNRVPSYHFYIVLHLQSLYVFLSTLLP